MLPPVKHRIRNLTELFLQFWVEDDALEEAGLGLFLNIGSNELLGPYPGDHGVIASMDF